MECLLYYSLWFVLDLILYHIEIDLQLMLLTQLRKVRFGQDLKKDNIVLTRLKKLK